MDQNICHPIPCRVRVIMELDIPPCNSPGIPQCPWKQSTETQISTCPNTNCINQTSCVPVVYRPLIDVYKLPVQTHDSRLIHSLLFGLSVHHETLAFSALANTLLFFLLVVSWWLLKLTAFPHSAETMCTPFLHPREKRGQLRITRPLTMCLC